MQYARVERCLPDALGPMASPRTLPLQGSSTIASGGCRRLDVLVPKLSLQKDSSSSAAFRNGFN